MPIALGVYIAAPFQLRNLGILARSGILSMGLYSTAHWLDLDSDDWNDDAAKLDLKDIDRATVVLAINPSDWATRGTGGRHFELGYAYARRKDIIIWGERTNVFHSLSTIQIVPDLTTAITLANDLARGLSLA